MTAATTQEIIDASTGVTHSPAYFGDGSDLRDSTDHGGRLVIESYPIYAPVPGITFRINGNEERQAVWIDVSMTEAYAVLADLSEMVGEVDRACGSESIADDDEGEGEGVTVIGTPKADEPKDTHVATWWVRGEYDPEVHPADKADKVPVVLSNRRDLPVVWLSPDAAKEMVQRLNFR